MDAVGRPIDRVFTASQWQLIWWKFRRHRLAMVSFVGLVLLYLSVAFADFLAPNDPRAFYQDHLYARPTRIRLFHEGRLTGPFIYPVVSSLNQETWLREYVPDTARRLPDPSLPPRRAVPVLGLLPSDLHLFGVEGEPIFLFGTDGLGRDIFTRVLHGGRISLTIGLVGIVFTFVLGLLLGGIAGYVGGAADEVIMRLIDFLVSIPTLPLWMALSRPSRAPGPSCRPTSPSRSSSRSWAGRASRASCAASSSSLQEGGLRDRRARHRVQPRRASSSVTCCPRSSATSSCS